MLTAPEAAPMLIPSKEIILGEFVHAIRKYEWIEQLVPIAFCISGQLVLIVCYSGNNCLERHIDRYKKPDTMLISITALLNSSNLIKYD